MPDLGPLFARAEALARQAIDTGGTTVTIAAVATVVDPETLDEVETVTPVGGSLPALIVPVGATTREVLPGVELRSTDWRVILHPDVTPPPAGHRVTVTACRSTALVGEPGRVLGHVLDSSGAILTVYARPR